MPTKFSRSSRKDLNRDSSSVITEADPKLRVVGLLSKQKCFVFGLLTLVLFVISMALASCTSSVTAPELCVDTKVKCPKEDPT